MIERNILYRTHNTKHLNIYQVLQTNQVTPRWAATRDGDVYSLPPKHPTASVVPPDSAYKYRWHAHKEREREGERDVAGIAHQSSTKECILTTREAVPWTRNRFYRSGEVMVADRSRCHTCPREAAMAVRFTC